MGIVEMLTDIMTSGGIVTLGSEPANGEPNDPAAYYVQIEGEFYKRAIPATTPEEIPVALANAYALWSEYRSNLPKELS